MLRIALVYAILLAAIIIAADTGFLPKFAERLHDLPLGDKVFHFFLFGVLALVANLTLASYGKRSLVRAIVIGSITVLIIATAEEYSNQFLSRRDWSLADLGANYLGVICVGWMPLWQPQLFSRNVCRRPDDSCRPQNGASC